MADHRAVLAEKLKRMSREDSEGCWRWTGQRNQKGYGQVKFQGVRYVARRIAHEIWKGHVGTKRIINTCPHNDCINPAHLRLATHYDIARRHADKFHRGEQVKGSKLTEAKVRKIIEMRKDLGYTLPELAERFGVCTDTVWRILNGRQWQHVTQKGHPRTPPGLG